jgi:hypothetical protein
LAYGTSLAITNELIPAVFSAPSSGSKKICCLYGRDVYL